MKKIIPFLAGLLCIAACNQLIEDPAVEPETNERITPTIIADSPSYSTSPSTRTEIHTITNAEDIEEIHTYWSAQDGLWVALCVDGMTTEPGGFYEGRWAFVTDNTQASQKATFTLNDDDPPFDGHTFYAIHPLTGDNVQEVSYIQGSDGKFYSALAFNIPVKQHPGAQTFDSDADLMVSESFSFNPENPIVDGLAFTRMNAIIKINFVDKTANHLFDKMGINAVTFGPKEGNNYLTGITYCQPHDELYGFSLNMYLEMYPEYYEEILQYYPAYPYVSAEYSSNDHPCIGAIDAVYLLVHPTTLTGADYPDGLPVQVELDDYIVTRNVTLPEGGIDLPAGLVTTLNISLYDNGVKETTIVEKQEIEFADPLVRSICLDCFDANEDGVLDTGEAARVTSLLVVNPGPAPKSRGSSDFVSPFRGTNISSFNELQYFTGLESIEYEAFARCGSLSSIRIPNSVTTIDERAFEDCSNLSSITFPSSVTTIKENAFIGAGLVSITIPNTVTTIEEGAFSWCAGLTSFQGPYASSDGEYLICDGTLIAIAIPTLQQTYSIPDNLGLTKIGAFVFAEREELTSVIIPVGVQSIGRDAFLDCSNLTTVSLPESILELAQEAFCWCESLANINFPEGLRSIGALAFQDCHSLTSITLPGTVTYMGNQAFVKCTGLTSLTLSEGMTDTGSGGRVFGDCTSLTTVSLPSTLTTVSYQSFQKCTALSRITIPASVTLLDTQAFQYCYSLEKVILKPTTPPELQNNVFNNTTANLIFVVPDGTRDTYIKPFSPWSQYYDVMYEESDPNIPS